MHENRRVRQLESYADNTRLASNLSYLASQSQPKCPIWKPSRVNHLTYYLASLFSTYQTFPVAKVEKTGYTDFTDLPGRDSSFLITSLVRSTVKPVGGLPRTSSHDAQVIAP